MYILKNSIELTNILFYLLIAAGLLVFLSQSTYAKIAGTMYGYRDHMTIPRLRPLQKKADMIHCIHHSAHAACGLLLICSAIALLKPEMGVPVTWISVAACLILSADALVFISNCCRHRFSTRRDDITKKWKGEKVFGPEHDNEVSLYRTLREITSKNLKRDPFHAAVEELDSHLLMSTSLGGLFVMYADLSQKPWCRRILCNPACHISKDIREKIGFGVKDYFVPRQDGVQQYVLDESVCEAFEAAIRDVKRPQADPDQDCAVFSIHDELIGQEGILANMVVCQESHRDTRYCTGP